MARVVLVSTGSFKFVFQIGAGVGLNRPNNRSDVALVQFFLEKTRYVWGGTTTVDMDGTCGKVTTDSILAFQHFVNKKYGSPILKTDSAVDPIRTVPFNEASPGTLANLHVILAQSNPGLYPTIHGAAAFHAALVPELFKL